MKDIWSRRDCLVSGGSLLTLGATLLVSGCGKQTASAASCSGDATLTDSDKQARATLAYVDQSPVSGKECNNCSLYKAAEPQGACGGCQILKGAISERGYCSAWAPKSV